MTTSTWLLLQLSDGAFPSGAFAHSFGLEATTVLGGLRDGEVSIFLDASLRQIASAALPFVRSATIAPTRLAELDGAYDATLPMLAPNQASRAQGRALASAASRVWDVTSPIADHARGAGPAHHAPVFGALFGTLGIDPDDAIAAYLHGSARGILSAAVRLGLLGPLEAQHLLAERGPLLDVLREGARELDIDKAAQTAPLLELFAALHDRLDGRMFQS
jgi:urease accessory protein